MRIRTIICIFGLLFLASCQEVTIPEFSHCHAMTISDALPVQFWLSDCDTYNETVPKGVHEKCFCAPWQCDDEINVQFQEETGGTYVLFVQDSELGYLGEVDFDETEPGIYSASFTPNSLGICNETVSFIICTSVVSGLLLAPDEWSAIFGAGFSGLLGSTDSTKFYAENASAGAANLSAYQPIIVPDGESITFDYNLGIVSGDITVGFALLDSANGTVSNTEQVNSSTPGTTQHTVTLTSTGAATKLWISVAITGTPFEASIELLDIAESLMPAVVTGAQGKSDCLHITTTQDETELIEYSNARNFAGLVYQDISPDASFKIRVPCRFFHEVFPEEDEAIELTSSVITTSGQLKSQKLLEVQHVPYYFHKKLQLILKHQTVTINDVNYQKEEKYEINQGNKQWPLKSATCLLTEKNSVLRNVL